MSQESIETVRRHYDADPAGEYARIDGRPEFLITMRFMRRYFRPGDRILDVGGGPGRYAIALAKLGCAVTLVDLSPENVRFAMEKAAESGVHISAAAGDARFVDSIVQGEYDHVLLMGPLYHLQTEAEREQAVRACLKRLRPGGTFWAAFILMFAGVIYMMQHSPEAMLTENVLVNECKQAVLDGKSFTGAGFTDIFYIDQQKVAPFMAKFPLEKLHMFGQESILAPCEQHIMGSTPEAVEAWLDFSEKLADREQFLSWSEHLMYVGRKISENL